jgi:dTDP-glucose pyrophosphorylase
MTEPIRKAVILAAGRGTRMGDLTAEIPKPMLQVQGKPLIQHILEKLEIAGLREFAIVTGYQGKSIESFLGRWHLPITFLKQEPVNGTGTAAMLARAFTGGENFLLSFGDILCEPSAYLSCMNALSEGHRTVAVVGVKDVDDPWQGAAVYEAAGRIERIVEKPPIGTSATRWNSAGVYVFRDVVYQHLAKLTPSVRGEYELTSAIESMLAEGLELRIGRMDGQWRDVGRPEDLAAGESMTRI